MKANYLVCFHLLSPVVDICDVSFQGFSPTLRILSRLVQTLGNVSFNVDL